MSTINPNGGELSETKIAEIFDPWADRIESCGDILPTWVVMFARAIEAAAIKADRERRGTEPVGYFDQRELAKSVESGRNHFTVSIEPYARFSTPLYLSPTAGAGAPDSQFDLDDDASEVLKSTIGDDDCVSRVTLSICDGHEGRGLYVWATDDPGEGSILLQKVAAGARDQPRESISEHPELDIMSFAYEAAYVSGAIHGFDTDAFDKLRRVVDAALARNSSGHSVAPSVQLSDALLRARCAALERAFDVRRWNIEQSHAWHRAIPDTAKAFRDLYEATTVPDSSDSVPLAANRMDRNQAGDPSAPQDSGG